MNQIFEQFTFYSPFKIKQCYKNHFTVCFKLPDMKSKIRVSIQYYNIVIIYSQIHATSTAHLKNHI